MSKLKNQLAGSALGWRWSAAGILLAVVCASIMYWSVFQQGYNSVLDRAESEAALITQLTRTFVKTYSNIGAAHSSSVELPIPSTFRAKALQRIDLGSNHNEVSIRVVGPPDREIATAATDDIVRQQLRELGKTSFSSEVLSTAFETSGRTFHRSIGALTASAQTCVDCHNRIQNLTGDNQWLLGDMMGAQIIEQSIEPQLLQIRRTALVQAALLFVALLAAWYCIRYLLLQYRLNGELNTLATTDPLTGLINRREFQRRISALKGRTDGALLMMDLDKFKQINDTYGHDAGDTVLCNFTENLQRMLRESDWVVRFGGEEFVVWLPKVKPLIAIKIAERIRENTEISSVELEGTTLNYTVSIGLHMVQNATVTDFDEWIKSADKLVYRAKEEGRNRIVCEIAEAA